MNLILKSRLFAGRALTPIHFTHNRAALYLWSQACFSSNKTSNLYGERINVAYPEHFGDISKGPAKVIIKKREISARINKQPIPIKDFINFKVMSGNEIILNLDNIENLRNGEMISGMLELGKRDKDNEFDWNSHPVTAKCIKELKKRMGTLNAMNALQAAMLM